MKLLDNFILGINYWESENATQMWKNYNKENVEKDFQILHENGIEYIRVFPLWSDFQPLTALYGGLEPYEYSFGEQPLPDTEAGRAGVSEVACEEFEHLCDMADKYNLKLIVALITGQMSFRWFIPPAFEGKKPFSDPTVIKWQIRFVKYFVSRFKERREIVGWDLGNEVNTLVGEKPDHFYVCCSTIANTVRACDNTRPVISGLGDISGDIERKGVNLKVAGEICDVHTIHPYNIFTTDTEPLCSMAPIIDLAFKCRLSEDIAGVPTFVQEVGSIGYMNCSPKTEANYYRGILLTCFAHDCHGVMWWCAFDQGHLRFTPYNWNNIGSDYGFFDKDRNPKPLVAEHNKFVEFLKDIPERKLPKYTRNGVVVVPRDDGDANIDTLRAAYILGKRANIDLGFVYCKDSIPDAPLYILPSLSNHKSIPATRLDEILKKVEEGAVFYLSVDTALFRQVPQIFGVDIAWRQCTPTDKIVKMGSYELPVKVDVEFAIESTAAEIIATDENGMPVFFKKKYGKGYVYFSTIPFEKYVSKRRGAYFNQDEPKYDVIYREMVQTAGITRCVDSDSPFIRFTEHPIDENNTYVFAINYAHDKLTVPIEVKCGRIVPVVGATPEKGMLTIEGNAGVIFKIIKDGGRDVI